MNMTSEREVYVHIQLPGSHEPVPAALLKIETLPSGTNIGRFRYGNRYLQRPNAIELDPFVLPLGEEVHAFTTFNGLPGAVRDAAPDAWGRRVIEHRLEKTQADLHEIDYLLNGPQDGAGYLSFSATRELKPSRRSFNRTHQLSDLVKAAEDIEEGKRVPEYLLDQLEPGTSMGGARPKATLEDDNRLWIGKFPEKKDSFNIQRVEFSTLELAKRSGIATPATRLQAVGGQDVLMIARFDREYSPKGYFRFGLVSALTLLRGDEDYLNRERWSYPLLADELRRWSAQPTQDAKELYRRMVFNAAITNNDDHPRNHALLRNEDGWCLAPAYDLIPSPAVSIERRDLAMQIGRYGRTASIYNLVSEAQRFGLSDADARQMIKEIVAVVEKWRDVFEEGGVSLDDIEKIAPAFLPQCFFSEQSVEAV